MEIDGGCGAVGPDAGHWQLQGRGPGLCPVGGSPGVIRKPGGKAGAGQHLEVASSRAARDQPELLAAGGAEEQLDRRFGLSCLEQRGGEVGGRFGGVEALTGAVEELDALQGACEREVDVAHTKRRR